MKKIISLVLVGLIMVVASFAEIHDNSYNNKNITTIAYYSDKVSIVDVLTTLGNVYFTGDVLVDTSATLSDLLEEDAYNAVLPMLKTSNYAFVYNQHRDGNTIKSINPETLLVFWDGQTWRVWKYSTKVLGGLTRMDMGC